MDNLKYVQLACSKDKTRFQLVEVYRDRDCIVATDGHRVHISNSLADAEPHYLSGLDAVFPDYKQVMPQSKDQTGSILIGDFSIKARKNALAKFNKVNALLKSVYGKRPVVDILATDKGLYLVCDDERVGVNINIKLFEAMECSEKFSTHLNPLYLYDALQVLSSASNATIRTHGELGPISITSELNGNNTTAIVMPCRKK